MRVRVRMLYGCRQIPDVDGVVVAHELLDGVGVGHGVAQPPALRAESLRVSAAHEHVLLQRI